MDRVNRELVAIYLILMRKLEQFKSTRFIEALKDQRTPLQEEWLKRAETKIPIGKH
jgi:hypothetical protein